MRNFRSHFFCVGGPIPSYGIQHRPPSLYFLEIRQPLIRPIQIAFIDKIQLKFGQTKEIPIL
jgi:hypothetical protein